MRTRSWYNVRRLVAAFSVLLRTNERSSSGPAQENPHDEHLMRMGALAAGAAHDLRSPLTTMAVVVDELRQQPDAIDRGRLAENLRILSDQIETCRHILSDLAAHGEGLHPHLRKPRNTHSGSLAAQPARQQHA